MATFHVVGKPKFTILVVDFGVVQVIENVLCAMFAFWQGSVHVSKDIYYAKNNVVLNFVYQVLDVNFGGMFWTVTNDKNRIVNKKCV